MSTVFYVLATLAVTIHLANIYSKRNRDDTDAPAERSGLMVYTDHATGVQYLSTVAGGLTVRVDKDGKPLRKE